jgi:hypothetical protein
MVILPPEFALDVPVCAHPMHTHAAKRAANHAFIMSSPEKQRNAAF